MIEKKTVCQIVDEWLEDKEYFLVEVIISPDDKIVVEIDHKEEAGHRRTGISPHLQSLRRSKRYLTIR